MTRDIEKRLARLEQRTPAIDDAEFAEFALAFDELLVDLVAHGLDLKAVAPDDVFDFNAIIRILDEVAAQQRDERLPASTAAILNRLAPDQHGARP